MDNKLEIKQFHVCRTCMAKITNISSLCSLDTIQASTEMTIKQKLHNCIPDLNLSIVPNAVICRKCTDAVNFIYQFKNTCLQSDMQIYEYMQQVQTTTDIIDLVEVIQFHQLRYESLTMKTEVLEITDFKNEESSCCVSPFNEEVAFTEHMEYKDFSQYKFSNTTENDTSTPSTVEGSSDTYDKSNVQECVSDNENTNNQDMPNRNNSRTRATWTTEQLQAAINAVRSGKAKRQSAREFGIPYSTLKTRFKTDNASEARLGRHSTFSPEQEAELAKRCSHLAKMFYGLTAMDLRKIGYEFAQRNNIPHRFNHNKKMAGKDWLQSFLKRHPHLSLRKPELTSLGRISGFNPESLAVFYKNLDEVLTKYNFQPNRVFNVAETSITTMQTPSKNVITKGVKQLGKAMSHEKAQNITICCSISASGIYIPPMFIYPRARMSEQLKCSGPVEATYECSSTGWMNEELFLSWLKHFQKHAATSNENQALLLLDYNGSHCSLMAHQFCRENGIIMLSFPPHTSRNLQPLDLTFFRPLKAAYSNECSVFTRHNVHQQITSFDVAEIFNRAFVRVATMEKAQKGFEISGIVPYRPNTFTEEHILPATLAKTPFAKVNEYETDISSTSTERDVTPSTSKTNTSPKQNKTQAVMSLEEIIPLHIVANKVARKRGRKQEISKILTVAPEKTELIKTKQRKSQRRKKHKKVSLAVKRVTKKAKFDDSSSSASS